MAAMKKADKGGKSGQRAPVAGKGPMDLLADVMIELDEDTTLTLGVSVDLKASGVRLPPPTKSPKRANFGVCYDMGPQGRLQVACAVRSTKDLKKEKKLGNRGLGRVEVSGPIVVKR